MNTWAITVSRYRGQCAYVESVPDYGLERSGVRGALKVEDTWCEMLGEFSSRIRYSSEKLFEGWWHGRHLIRTATRTAICMSVTSTGTTAGGTGATTGWTTTSTATTPLRCVQLSSLLTPLTAGLSFGKLAVPTAEHPSYLLHLQGEQAVLIRVDGFRLP